MAKNAPAGKLTFSATQGSADAFVQSEITTGLDSLGTGGIALRVLEIVTRRPLLPGVSCNLEMSITRTSQNAVPSLTERALIWSLFCGVSFTTSGATYQSDLTARWQPQPDANVIVVESTLFFQLDSANTSASNVVTGYILFEQVKITETDRLALLAQSLA